MMTMMGHGYDEDPYLFHIRLVRSHHYHHDCWRCRGCTMMVIGDDDDDGRRSFNHHYQQRMHDDGYHR